MEYEQLDIFSYLKSKDEIQIKQTLSVGDKIGRNKVEVSFVDEGIVDSITLGYMMVPQINVCNNENVWTTFDAVEDFGNTVFLTKESAEAALKEMSE